MFSAPKSSLQLYRAPWVIPVTSPVLRDGAVLVDGDRIAAVASFSDLAARFPDLPHTHCSGVLLPALVNCHIHLDLSVYGTVYPDPADRNMCDWIRKLTRNRLQSTCSEEEVKDAADKTATDQFSSGVGLMLDIGNVSLGSLATSPVEIQSLFEMLGPSKAAEQAAIAKIQTYPSDLVVTGHAPYSTAPGLLKYIKKRSREQDDLFSLHLAENQDEALLLERNEGCFPQFLKERGAGDNTYPIPGMNSSGVVGYLDTLGLFDKNTICVHCVHLSSEEMEIIVTTGSHICLCPGSNKFLGVGKAPLEQILEHNILPALGTDSIASNAVLDMWVEMALVRQEHPDVSPETVLAMATLGGAKAMQKSSDYGSLEEGCKARILQIQGRPYQNVDNADQLLDVLTSSGHPESIIWL